MKKHQLDESFGGARVFKATEWLQDQIERIYAVKADKSGVDIILYEVKDDK